MPVMQAISINDGKATPVAHVFDPLTTNGKKAVFVNRSSGIPSAYERLELELVEPKSPTGAYRIIGSMYRPILATVNGVQVVARTQRINFDINESQSGSLDERKDDVALFANLLDHTVLRTMVQNLEPCY